METWLNRYLPASLSLPRRRQRSEEEQIPIPGLVADPVVSLEQFQQVQKRLARNKAQGGKVLHTYLLRGPAPASWRRCWTERHRPPATT